MPQELHCPYCDVPAEKGIYEDIQNNVHDEVVECDACGKEYLMTLTWEHVRFVYGNRMPCVGPHKFIKKNYGGHEYNQCRICEHAEWIRSKLGTDNQGGSGAPA